MRGNTGILMKEIMEKMKSISQRIQEHCVKIELLLKDIHDCEAKRYMTKMFERMNIDEAMSQQVGDQSRNAESTRSRSESKR